MVRRAARRPGAGGRHLGDWARVEVRQGLPPGGADRRPAVAARAPARHAHALAHVRLRAGPMRLCAPATRARREQRRRARPCSGQPRRANRAGAPEQNAEHAPGARHRNAARACPARPCSAARGRRPDAGGSAERGGPRQDRGRVGSGARLEPHGDRVPGARGRRAHGQQLVGLPQGVRRARGGRRRGRVHARVQVERRGLEWRAQAPEADPAAPRAAARRGAAA